MYSRLKGKVIVRVIYLIVMIYFKIRILDDVISFRSLLPSVIAQGSLASSELDSIFNNMITNLLAMMILMTINLMFFTTRITKFFVAIKMGKSMDLANFATIVDGTMFSLGVASFIWSYQVRSRILEAKSIQSVEPIDETAYKE
jgi:hypothetical protein